MITITIKLENLTEKMEQYLEKEFADLEKITKKPREYHYKEALINYILNYVEDPEEVKEIEKYIKKNNFPASYHIIEALIIYIKDMKDIREIKRRVKTKTKYYTGKEVDQRLKELRAKNV